MMPPGNDGGKSEEEADDEALELICKTLEDRPQLAPALAQWLIPEYTFAPSRCITERRYKGQIKDFQPSRGWGVINCPELKEVFGFDVVLDREQICSFTNNDIVEFAPLISKDGKPQAFDLSPCGGYTKNGWPLMGFDNGPLTSSGSSPAPGKGAVDMWDDKAKGMGKPTGISSLEMAAQALAGSLAGVPGVTGVKRKSLSDLQEEVKASSGESAGQQSASTSTKSRGTGDTADSKSNSGTAASPQFFEERQKGVMKSVFPDKGFAYIECEKLKGKYERDVWVHIMRCPEDIEVGQTVSFKLALNYQGHPQALDVKRETFWPELSG